MIQFKLKELRKRQRLTQQELGDILHVSYQTISKWENQVVLPDISVLPQISSYFGVSVDALLGLVPLEQKYSPSGSETEAYWDKKQEDLNVPAESIWNEDYIGFLIREVWKVRTPISVLDCGCGTGRLGFLLMPLLPEGSRYVGVDFSRKMIDAAEETNRNLDTKAEFVLADIRSWRPKEKYDMVISQAILRHVNDGEELLRKMTDFLKKDGILVSMECNREFEAGGLYIRGIDYGTLCRHQRLETLWRTELEMENRDYSIAMKIPYYMKNAGLKNVACRMNDKVTFLEPEQPEYAGMLKKMVRAEHWDVEKTEDETEKIISSFMNHGMSRKEAEDYCRQQEKITAYLKKRRGDVAVTKAAGYMISYGWK